MCHIRIRACVRGKLIGIPPSRSIRRKFLLAWSHLAGHKALATEKAEELFARITRAFASTTISAVFAEWRRTARQGVRLRLVLQKVLGRYLELAFYGWR